MVRAHIRRNSATTPPLSLGPLPPTPAPDAASPVSPTQLKREPTPFDELPMSHLISFPIMDSPTSGDSVDSSPFDAFHSYSSYPPSSSLLRDAFDYYRLPPNNSQAMDLNIPMHSAALKPQLHAHSLPDLTNALVYAAPNQQQQQQQQQQQCIPTSHLFPLATPIQSIKSSPSPVEDDASPPPSSSSQLQSQTQKKRPPRAAISTKDFVPPDVSGLSKREARLVKNRAAAFLSRQRKREEFETMEIRVAQLEQENARLLAMTRSQSHSRSSSPAPSLKAPKSEPGDTPLDAELASLRSLLSQSRARTAELEAELARVRNAAPASTASSSDAGSDIGSPGAPIQVKRESMSTDAIPKRAGLFGVVLLCALPSLLSLPAPTLPQAASRFSFTPGPGALHPRPAHTESLLDWTGMEVDVDGDSGAERRKVHLPLSFLNGQSGVGDLFQNGFSPEFTPSFADDPTEAEFDVSFAPSSTSGKIRVRIESPQELPVPGLTREGSSPPSSLGSGSPALAYARAHNVNAHAADGWDLDFSPEHAHTMMWDTPTAHAGANVDVALFAPSQSGRRRVRIALKSAPVAGAEGGEWEVEVR